MNLLEEIRTGIFKIRGEDDFNDLALKIFAYQYELNPLLRQFSGLFHTDPAGIKHYRDIPFLPVSFFRDLEVVSGNRSEITKVFSSSGTTGSIPSKHYVRDLALYEESFISSFRFFYGDPGNYRFLALLPGYLEREGSSLVYMMDYLVRITKGNGSGFYLHDFQSLKERLTDHPEKKVKTVLFGASYALLDFSENYPIDLQHVVIMETGGMKGRRKEMVREELHEILCSRFNAGSIHSEYGMTELLSQGYSPGNGIFRTPPWMKVLVRDPNDPLELLPAGQTGGINIIDLANIHSCSFIATQDLGKLHDDGSFEVLGRFDDSDVRGCNLLVV
jgi:hypothetical protein